MSILAVSSTTSRMTSSGAGALGKDLYEFLVEAELAHYYQAFRTDLKVTSVPQIKYVEDEDLTEVGMSRPEVRRLKKFFRKECPQGAFGKIKKVHILLSTKEVFGSLVLF